MKKNQISADRKQQDLSKKQSLIAGVHNSKEFAESDRIEWLKQLYAEWQEKRNPILKYNKESYLIFEPDEFDTEVYW